MSELNTEPLYTDRGFSGHEYLSEFNLINMNGRVNDQITARFLIPDPYIQMSGMQCGFNRLLIKQYQIIMKVDGIK
jgi:hypothetical protein